MHHLKVIETQTSNQWENIDQAEASAPFQNGRLNGFIFKSFVFRGFLSV